MSWHICVKEISNLEKTKGASTREVILENKPRFRQCYRFPSFIYSKCAALQASHVRYVSRKYFFFLRRARCDDTRRNNSTRNGIRWSGLTILFSRNPKRARRRRRRRSERKRKRRKQRGLFPFLNSKVSTFQLGHVYVDSAFAYLCIQDDSETFTLWVLLVLFMIEPRYMTMYISNWQSYF